MGERFACSLAVAGAVVSAFAGGVGPAEAAVGAAITSASSGSATLTTDRASPAVDPASSATAEIERYGFESVHDGPFELFNLDGDLWLVESEFSALRIDPAVATSNCVTSRCLSAGHIDFGDTFVAVGARLFAVETNFSPNQFVWLGSELSDTPHIVQDEHVAPGDARGQFSTAIAGVGDRVYAYDAASAAVESIDATSDAIDSQPIIGTPIPVDPPFPDSAKLLADDDEMWLFSNGNIGSYGDFGPVMAAVVDVDAGRLGERIALTSNEYGAVHSAAVAGGRLIVSGYNSDETGRIEPFLTAFAPDGNATPLETPAGSLRNMTASGDRALVVMEEAGHRTFVIDPVAGSVGDPIDLGVNPDATVTAWYGADNGVWAVADGPGAPSVLLRIDLASETVVERIELTDELDDAIGPSYVDGRPYFVVGDGTSGQWELVILGGNALDLVQPTPEPDSDPAPETGPDPVAPTTAAAATPPTAAPVAPSPSLAGPTSVATAAASTIPPVVPDGSAASALIGAASDEQDPMLAMAEVATPVSPDGSDVAPCDGFFLGDQRACFYLLSQRTASLMEWEAGAADYLYEAVFTLLVGADNGVDVTAIVVRLATDALGIEPWTVVDAWTPADGDKPPWVPDQY